MAACALEFEAGGTGIYQILASRRGVETSLPLTRADLYEAKRSWQMAPPS
jgi:cyclopropane-fatty-acyl-phospholipid synthase